MSHDGKNYRARIFAWLKMLLVFFIALYWGKRAALVLFGLVSYLGLKEYFAMAPTRRADRRVMFWAYVSIPFQYYWIYLEWYGMFVVFIPVYLFMILPVRMMLIGEVKGFLQAAGTLQWGVMSTVFFVSHLGYLLTLPDRFNPNGGAAAIFALLILLTEINFLSQHLFALAGSKIGLRHIILPAIDHEKTWEGFLLALGLTITLIWFAAPYFSPLSPLHSILAGGIIGLGGFLGEITFAAIRKDLEEGSGSLPPRGIGMLDRMSGLIFTAPLFFHFYYYMYC